MRPLSRVLAALVFALALARSASAAIVVDIDRSVQRMAVTVDGVPRYSWRVSTARRGYVTPPGTHHPEMLARHWFSRKYYNSPMLRTKTVSLIKFAAVQPTDRSATVRFSNTESPPPANSPAARRVRAG